MVHFRVTSHPCWDGTELRLCFLAFWGALLLFSHRRSPCFWRKDSQRPGAHGATQPAPGCRHPGHPHEPARHEAECGRTQAPAAADATAPGTDRVPCGWCHLSCCPKSGFSSSHTPAPHIFPGFFLPSFPWTEDLNSRTIETRNLCLEPSTETEVSVSPLL